MMPTVSRTLQRTAFLLVLCILLGSFSGCFGRGKDPQEETSDSTGNTYYWDDIIETVPEETATESTDPTEESTEPTEESTEPTEETEPEGLKGTVIGDILNIRSGPGTGYGISGSLKKNDRVLILEQKIVDDALWGETEDGWISLNYVLLDDPDQVLTVKETLKGIALEKLKLYAGPGSHYTASGTISKDTRISLLETCGKWGRTEKGWVDLEDVYIDGTEGPEDPVKGTVTGSKVNVRSDPSTQSTVKDTVNSGDRVEIFYQVKIGDMTWGCTADGWISMDYVRLDDDISEDIVGSWYIHSASSGKEHIFSLWTFKKDGSFTIQSELIHEDRPDNRENMANCSGTYVLDGSTLTMAFTSGGDTTRITICGTTYIFPCTVTLTVKLQGDQLKLSVGSKTDTLTNGSLQDGIDEFMANLEPEDPIDPSILGSWYYQTEVTSHISVGTIYVFHADGTYEYTSFSVDWDGNGNIEKTGSGTYSFDGSTLVRDGRSYPAVLKNGRLQLTESGYTHIYSPGGLEDAVEEARSWYDITEPTDPEPTETEPPVLDSSIVGSWFSRIDSGTNSRQYYIFNFSSDGTYTSQEVSISTTTPGKYSVSTNGYGKYTFDGTTLIMGSNGHEDKMQNGKLYIQRRYSSYWDGDIWEFTRGDLDDAIADVHGNSEEVNNTSILGSWYCLYARTGTPYGSIIYTFNADGTYECNHFDVRWDGSCTMAQMGSGTYYYDGNTLVCDNISYSAEIKDGYLHLGNTNVYTHGTLGDAIDEALGKSEETEP